MKDQYDPGRCECGRPATMTSKGRHANPGHKRRKGHTLCRQCWRSQLDRERAAAIGRPTADRLVGFEVR